MTAIAEERLRIRSTMEPIQRHVIHLIETGEIRHAPEFDDLEPWWLRLLERVPLAVKVTLPVMGAAAILVGLLGIPSTTVHTVSVDGGIVLAYGQFPTVAKGDLIMATVNGVDVALAVVVDSSQGDPTLRPIAHFANGTYAIRIVPLPTTFGTIIGLDDGTGHGDFDLVGVPNDLTITSPQILHEYWLTEGDIPRKMRDGAAWRDNRGIWHGYFPPPDQGVGGIAPRFAALHRAKDEAEFSILESLIGRAIANYSGTTPSTPTTDFVSLRSYFQSVDSPVFFFGDGGRPEAQIGGIVRLDCRLKDDQLGAWCIDSGFPKAEQATAVVDHWGRADKVEVVLGEVRRERSEWCTGMRCGDTGCPGFSLPITITNESDGIVAALFSVWPLSSGQPARLYTHGIRSGEKVLTVPYWADRRTQLLVPAGESVRLDGVVCIPSDAPSPDTLKVPVTFSVRDPPEGSDEKGGAWIEEPAIVLTRPVR